MLLGSCKESIWRNWTHCITYIHTGLSPYYIVYRLKQGQSVPVYWLHARYTYNGTRIRANMLSRYLHTWSICLYDFFIFALHKLFVTTIGTGKLMVHQISSSDSQPARKSTGLNSACTWAPAKTNIAKSVWAPHSSLSLYYYYRGGSRCQKGRRVWVAFRHLQLQYVRPTSRSTT